MAVGMQTMLSRYDYGDYGMRQQGLSGEMALSCLKAEKEFGQIMIICRAVGFRLSREISGGRL